MSAISEVKEQIIEKWKRDSQVHNHGTEMRHSYLGEAEERNRERKERERGRERERERESKITFNVQTNRQETQTDGSPPASLVKVFRLEAHAH